ncbi:sigma-54-dependent transcriptional regulator [Vulgatibacter incomptus]|uniref:Response regulator of zinc sigma-54-dependent two-component system n=1 Tax=Vulgatibacter incomptus TaxID=1391653 RepID=A0A0K1PDB1_9BACT|nr:sigma-54 dependent transcriptional regulator [Vulgatibacter incomptus]AKU91391.1 Response regulator of zinc sigma-54-dependent two-component system [Vulgatibacter incomptus]
METILVVDDNTSLAEMLALQLEVAEGDRPAFTVETAGSVAEARTKLARIEPVLVLCDMRLPDGDGVALLPEIRALSGEAPVVIMTAHGDMETTIRAMKAGAFDYLQKPFDQDEVEMVALRALDLRRHSRRAAMLAVDTSAPHLVNDIVSDSPQMKSIVKQIGKIASSQASVLIQGESGTGKELIARVIHTYSSDEPKPFVGINCSAIVDTLLESELFGHEKGSFTGATQTKYGKFELAEDGTIFLDEIGEMSLPLQAKLLRVLQEREFERVGGVARLPLRARIVAATNRDIEKEAKEGRFRDDLYQRLKVVTIELPPLRERASDIPKLTQGLLARIGRSLGKRITKVPAELISHLQSLPWHGNVRELENALTRAVVLAPGGVLLPEYFPAPAAHAMPAARPADSQRRSLLLSLAEAEREAILRAIEASGGHKGRVCDILGISRPTLERKLEKHAIPFRRSELEPALPPHSV